MSNTYRKTCPDSWAYKYEDKGYQSDVKPYCKPNSKFKKAQKQRRKAKEKQAMRSDPENVPVFKKSDQWDWL